jgi:hypothetical protein
MGAACVLPGKAAKIKPAKTVANAIRNICLSPFLDFCKSPVVGQDRRPVQKFNGARFVPGKKIWPI